MTDTPVHATARFATHILQCMRASQEHAHVNARALRWAAERESEERCTALRVDVESYVASGAARSVVLSWGVSLRAPVVR